MLVNLLTIKTKFSLFLFSQMFIAIETEVVSALDAGSNNTITTATDVKPREDLRHPLYLICKFSSIHFMSHTKV